MTKSFTFDCVGGNNETIPGGLLEGEDEDDDEDDDDVVDNVEGGVNFLLLPLMLLLLFGFLRKSCDDVAGADAFEGIFLLPLFSFVAVVADFDAIFCLNMDM